MRTVEEYETIRRAYFFEGKNIQEISRQVARPLQQIWGNRDAVKFGAE